MSRVLYIMDVGLKTEKMDKVHCVLDKGSPQDGSYAILRGV